MGTEVTAPRGSLHRVISALAKWGLDGRVRMLGESTRTSQDAANALGVKVGQIAKSLLFMAGEEPILVIASGANRVSERKLEAYLSSKVRKARAEEVRDLTGFAIGGVPPVGHKRHLRVMVDEDLLQFAEIYAAAGTPNAVFGLTPKELLEITGGAVLDLKEEG
jgi:prolyl-tRNA editing enzyme YbaK/EbsC (Cys-tRNA(Pro) deacylase)